MDSPPWRYPLSNQGTKLLLSGSGFSFEDSIMEVAPPRVGFEEPAYVRAEISIDVHRLSPQVRFDWDRLRPDDVVYLASVQPPSITNGHENGNGVSSEQHHIGLTHLRVATVVQVLDEHGKPLRDILRDQMDNDGFRPRSRRLVVDLDTVAYAKDNVRESKTKQNVYDGINLIVRRKGRENNFKRVLESIKGLTLSDVTVPEWLREVFLGYGEPSSACYKHLKNRLTTVDFRDTFLNQDHLAECLPELVGQHLKW